MTIPENITASAPYQAKVFDTFFLALLIISKVVTLPAFLFFIVTAAIAVTTGHDFTMTSQGLIFDANAFRLATIGFWLSVGSQIVTPLIVISKTSGFLNTIATPFNAVEVFLHKHFAKKP